MIEKSGGSLTARIIDFGLATRLDGPNQKLEKRCGSPGYVAPEILNDAGYNCEADVFSAGAILYMMLAGSALFKGATTNEVLANNMNCNVSFNHVFVQNVSDPAKDLVKKMIRKRPQDRISPKEALEHPWITGEPFIRDNS